MARFELGKRAVMFTPVTEATRWPEVPEHIGSASAQGDSVLDAPVPCWTRRLFSRPNHHFHCGLEQPDCPHAPLPLPGRSRLMVLESQLATAEVALSLCLPKDFQVNRF